MARSNSFEATERSESGAREGAAEGSTYRVRDGESVSQAVVRAMSSERQTDPTDLRPLYTVIDADALNSLFGARDGGVGPGDRRVAFDYCGRRVQVEAGGTIRVGRSTGP